VWPANSPVGGVPYSSRGTGCRQYPLKRPACDKRLGSSARRWQAVRDVRLDEDRRWRLCVYHGHGLSGAHARNGGVSEEVSEQTGIQRRRWSGGACRRPQLSILVLRKRGEGGTGGLLNGRLLRDVSAFDIQHESQQGIARLGEIW
jgi:hypothetical protein